MQRYRVKIKLHQDFVRAGDDENEIIVGVMSKPQQGRANSKVISKLAEHFGVSSSKVKIVAGFKSKNKIVVIEK